MNFFKDLTDDFEGFSDFKRKQDDDDEKIKKYFEQCNHKEFIFSLSKLGYLMETISSYLYFIEDPLKKAVDMKNKQSKKRKINKLIKDLNEKINLEFDFDDKTIIVEKIVLYDGELYLFFNKAHFIKTIGFEKISYK